MGAELAPSTRLLQWLLFLPGPFYFYPWKAIANSFAGDSYAVGYKHFADGHYGRINLALHCVALFIQTFGNFGLLAQLDRLLHTVIPVRLKALSLSNALKDPQKQEVEHPRLLSCWSAVAWGLCLARSPAPLAARLASCGSLAFAYSGASYASPEVFEVAAPAAMATALTIAQATATRPVSAQNYAKGMLLMAGWYAGWRWVRRRWAQAWSERRMVVRCVVLGFLSMLAVKKNPLRPMIVLGSIMCRTAAVLTDDPVLYYLGYAFTGSLFQGISHRITNEEATLAALERESEQDKLRYEWAHVTFFPVMVFHAVQEAIGAHVGAP
mmetsp:Transcript_9586/g.17807  ORF Transcript_9586/g.17807 Transcript_9586/m.17807 type:complete len:325 (+) Transcript_9586:81-1055(+)